MEKLLQTILDLFEKFMTTYFPNYLSWLTDKLSGLDPFFILSCSLGVVFALAIYISLRNKYS